MTWRNLSSVMAVVVLASIPAAGQDTGTLTGTVTDSDDSGKHHETRSSD